MNLQTIPEPERRSARERLLHAADALFYEGGINAVGIERVIERAGVAKASLYDCFGSKEALIHAYLVARQERRRARITASLAQDDRTPRDRLLGVFDALGAIFAEPGFRGCAFTRASADSRVGSSVKSVCDGARGWMLELFATLARDAGAGEPTGLARQMMLLYDGASVSAQMDGPGAAAAAKSAAALLLDAALPRAPATRTKARSAKRVATAG